jgi:hypothetical protein
MRNPFRKKKDDNRQDEGKPNLDQVKAKLREYEAERKLEQEDMKELCFEMGRTVFTCALVESNLNDAINYIGRSNADIVEWLERGKKAKKMVHAIQEIRRRFGIDQAFFDDLEKFRLSRNKLVHDIWNVPQKPIGTAEGRAEAKVFIRDVYTLGRRLNAIFAAALITHHGRSIGLSDETINSLLLGGDYGAGAC